MLRASVFVFECFVFETTGVTPLFKQGDRVAVNNYRPISVILCSVFLTTVLFFVIIKFDYFQ